VLLGFETKYGMLLVGRISCGDCLMYIVGLLKFGLCIEAWVLELLLVDLGLIIVI